MHTYLIMYGDENEAFICEAEDAQHAREQFHSWSEDNLGSINNVYVCCPVEMGE
jgi:hypothetical protein